MATSPSKWRFELSYGGGDDYVFVYHKPRCSNDLFLVFKIPCKPRGKLQIIVMCDKHDEESNISLKTLLPLKKIKLPCTDEELIEMVKDAQQRLADGVCGQ